MRYLNRREEFLKSYSKIVTEREKYVPEKGIESINEDSGPFANDIGWGDSLVGRLINSAIRKAKIGANLVRIKGVEKRLREAMDDLLLTSGIAELTPEDKSMYAKSIIATYLYALEQGVKNGEPMADLMNLTDTAIEAVEKEEVLEGKEELLRQLREWKKYLEQFKDEEDASQEETSEEEEEDLSDTTGVYLSNFSHLFKMMLIYQGIEKEKAEHYKAQALAKGAAGTSGTAGSAASATASASGSASGPASANANVGSNNRVTTNNENKLMKYEDFMKESAAGTVGKVAGKIWKFFTGGKDEKALDSDTKKLWQAMKPLYQLFGVEKGTLEREGELGKMLKDPKAMKGTTDYNKYKSNIDKIYSFVRSANGVNEDVHAFLGKNEQIGKAIAGIYAVTKTKQDGSFMQYPGTVGEVWDELVDQIAGFNKTMASVLKIESRFNVGDTVKWKSEKTGDEIQKEIVRIEGKKLVFTDKKGEEYTKFMSEVEKVGESVLFRYENIMKKFEAEGQTAEDAPAQAPAQATEEDSEKDGEVSGWKNPNSVTKIQDWWGKNVDLKQWMIKKTEVEKVRINLEKKLAAKKDAVVIQGMDPVLEIVKVFNRAYKLHTTQVIPSGRTGGKVSNKTFMEYHCFGSGTPANAGESGGPYRNIAIFNQWEDCVNDVMKDTRYQKIFNVGTQLKVGNEYIDKAGMNLRKFMTDMLDGEELYKGGSGKEQGAQAKFLDKYFGYKADTEGKDTYYSTSDRDEVTGLAKEIKDIEVQEKPGKTAIQYKDKKSLVGTFFKARMAEGRDGSDKNYYFYIQANYGGKFFLVFSSSGYFVSEYLKAAKGTKVKKPEGANWSRESSRTDDPYRLMATTISEDALFTNDGVIKLQATIEMGFITKAKVKDDKEDFQEETRVDNSGSNVDYRTVKKATYRIKDTWQLVDVAKPEERIKADPEKIKRVVDGDAGGYKDITNIEGLKEGNIRISNS